MNTIRLLSEKDADIISAFTIPTDLSNWSIDKVAGCLKHDNYCGWGLEADGVLSAYIIVNTAGLDAEIMFLSVEPLQRHQGFAYELLQLTLAELKNLHKENIILEVRADNTPAIKLYEKSGFQRVGERKDYYHISGKSYDAWVYNLSLLNKSC